VLEPGFANGTLVEKVAAGVSAFGVAILTRSALQDDS
jgi:hypothetical protein